MSKISDELIRRADIQIEYYAKFMDWLYENIIDAKLSSAEIDGLENESNGNKARRDELPKIFPNSLMNKSEMLPRNPLNNPKFSPKNPIGA